MENSRTPAQDNLLKRLKEIFPDEIVSIEPRKNYSKMSEEEIHHAAESIRKFIRNGVVPAYLNIPQRSKERAEYIQRYEDMTDLQVLKEEERIERTRYNDFKKQMKALNEAQKRTREKPSSIRYAILI